LSSPRARGIIDVLARTQPTAQKQDCHTDAIRAEIVGDHTCMALGVTVVGNAPILQICRQLVEAGHDPERPLQAYRGKTLCLTIASIGIAAEYAVANNRVGTPVFRRWRDRAPSSGEAPPVRGNRAAGIRAHAGGRS
jgi:hypothetical protein